MRRALVAVAAVSLLAGGAARAETAPSADGLLARLVRGGVACDARRAFPARGVEHAERRCSAFALATFKTSARRGVWVRARAHESWFAAAYVVYGARWAVWTASRDVAAGTARTLRGRVLELALPEPSIRVEKCRELLPPARPTPISPEGPVYSYKSETWNTSLTDTCTGLMIVAGSAPGTAALTGVVESFNAKGALSGVRATLQSVHVDGVADAPSTTLRTVTDQQGGYAFTDFPVAGAGSCYLLTVEAGRFGREEYLGFFNAEQFQQTLDMDVAEVGDGDAVCYRASTPAAAVPRAADRAR